MNLNHIKYLIESTDDVLFGNLDQLDPNEAAYAEALDLLHSYVDRTSNDTRCGIDSLHGVVETLISQLSIRFPNASDIDKKMIIHDFMEEFIEDAFDTSDDPYSDSNNENDFYTESVDNGEVLIEYQLPKEIDAVILSEKLSPDDPVDKWINDFQNSDAPQFKSKSMAEIRKMALAAYYSQQQRNEGIGMELLGIDKLLDGFRDYKKALIALDKLVKDEQANRQNLKSLEFYAMKVDNMVRGKFDPKKLAMMYRELIKEENENSSSFDAALAKLLNSSIGDDLVDAVHNKDIDEIRSLVKSSSSVSPKMAKQIISKFEAEL